MFDSSKTFLVGGAVRDQLLGLSIKERDWVVIGSTPEKLIAEGFKPVGKDFPVFLHPKTHEEYALARTERKVAPGYHGFTFHADPSVSLEEDLKRRDLTINAMAMDENGNLIDPYHGANDLKNKILRHVSDAFIEDPIRLLRIARFAARFYHLGFRVADETRILLQKIVRSGELSTCVPERIWKECLNALEQNNPHVFFANLRQWGALKMLFPEIDALFGVPNPPHWHPEIDSGWHTLMVLEQASLLSASALVRFCALTHDLGKATTPLTIWPSHRGHDERGISIIQTLCLRLKLPKHYREAAILTSRFHTLIHKCRELTSAKLLSLFEEMDAFRRKERFYVILTACVADARGRTGHENSLYFQQNYLIRYLAALKQVSQQALVAQGLKGEKLRVAIRNARIECIKQEKQHDSDDIPTI